MHCKIESEIKKMIKTRCSSEKIQEDAAREGREEKRVRENKYKLNEAKESVLLIFKLCFICIRNHKSYPFSLLFLPRIEPLLVVRCSIEFDVYFFFVFYSALLFICHTNECSNIVSISLEVIV